MKRKKVIIIGIIFIIVIAALTGVYRLKMVNGNIIYYDSFLALTSHSPLRAGRYIIYDSGVIEQYQSIDDELISSKKITKQELKELKNLIEKVSETSKPKKDSRPKANFAGVVAASGTYVYNNKKQEILLDDIESEELDSLEKFVENLKKKYCK